MTYKDRHLLPDDRAPRLSIAGQGMLHLILAMIIVTGGFRTNTFGNEDRASKIAAKVSPRLKTELAAKNLHWGAPVYMRIFKESNELELWIRGSGKKGEYVLFRNYKICYWSGKLGPKLKQGDRQSPEGLYSVNPGRMNPNSRYHLSFNLGYPNAYDKAKKRTGNYLMVHGDCVSLDGLAEAWERIVGEPPAVVEPEIAVSLDEECFVQVRLGPRRQLARVHR